MTADSPQLFTEITMFEKTKEQFEKLYQPEFELPETLAQEYELLSCMKYTEQKRLYLLLQKNSGKTYKNHIIEAFC